MPNCVARDSTTADVVAQLQVVSNSREATKACNALRLAACDGARNADEFCPGIELCLELLRYYADDVGVQKSGVLALAGLCEGQKLGELIGERGGVRVIFDAWVRFPEDSSLLKNIIVTCRSLTQHERNRVDFYALGGIEKTVAAMRWCFLRASIQSDASALLTNLCYENTTRKVSVASGFAIPGIVAAMERFNTLSDSRLQTNACMALRNLAAGGPDCETSLIAAGAVSRLTHAVETYRGFVKLVEEALGALTNLAVSKRLHFGAIQACAPVLSAAVRFLRSSKSSPTRYRRCHELAFILVRALAAGNEQCCATVRESESGLEQIVATVASHVALPHDALHGSLPAIAKACMALRLLAFNAENRRAIAGMPQGIRTIVECVRCLEYRPLDVEHALLALGNVVFDIDQAKCDVEAYGGLRVVVNILNNHKCISAVAEAGCSALRALCLGSTRNCIVTTNIMGHSVCAEIMASFGENVTLQEQAMSAILSMASGPGAIENIRHSNVSLVAEKAAQRFPYATTLVAQEAKLQELLASTSTSHASEPPLRLRKNKSKRLFGQATSRDVGVTHSKFRFRSVSDGL